ncbi:MAG: hypothetical protein CMM61_03420 [Rhodospirillaceae bacterium]|nr:hypothetical protein [Rhodospirillaceae bacterium]
MTTTHDLADTLATVTEALANTLLHHGHHLTPADLAARRRLVDEARRQLTPIPPDAAPKIEVVCHSCGSPDVGRDATAKWDTANQTWDLGTVYDQGFCEDCNGDAVLIERTAEDG